jgi:hypothetical protein
VKVPKTLDMIERLKSVTTVPHIVSNTLNSSVVQTGDTGDGEQVGTVLGPTSENGSRTVGDLDQPGSEPSSRVETAGGGEGEGE